MNKIINFLKLPRIYIWTAITIVVFVYLIIGLNNSVWLSGLIWFILIEWVLVLYYLYLLVNLFIEKFYKIWVGLILLPIIIHILVFLYQVIEEHISDKKNAWHRQMIKKVEFPPEYYLEYWKIKESDLELNEKIKLFDELKEKYSTN